MLKRQFWTSVFLGSILLISCGEEEDEKVTETPMEPDFTAPEIIGQSPLNFGNLKEAVGTTHYHNRGYRGRGVTVAILDNGFKGLEDAQGNTLPPDLEPEPFPEGQMSETYHGTKMAELVYHLATGFASYDATREGPEIKLFVTSGPYNNLKNAVDRLVATKTADPSRKIIALYSQIWEFGHNLDGTGYIPNLVKKATDAGILWINASGNVGQSTYADDLNLTGTGAVVLPSGDNLLNFRIPEDQTSVKIVLAWNDFKSSFTSYRTPWDLNMSLLDDKGESLGKSLLVQDGQDHDGEDGYSRHAREQMNAQLNKGTFSLKIWAKTVPFKANSKFWVVLSGRGVTIEHPTPIKVVMAPAAISSVVAVGGSDIAYSSTLVKNGVEIKPDIRCPSKMTFGEGLRLEGTSTAAAVCAGALSAFWQSRSTRDVKELLSLLILDNNKRMRLPRLL